MTQTEWFRREEWTPEIEAEFNARIARSRGQKGEYLRIQALTLADTGEIANALPAIQLATRQLELKGESISAAQMYAVVALAQTMLGNISEAIDAYRRATDAEHKRPNVRGHHYIEFAWFVATNRLIELYDEILSVIDRNKQDQDLMFPANQYRYFGALALISKHRGDSITAQKLAKLAIHSAQKAAGPFKSQPKLGLWSAKRDENYVRLERLAG